MLLIDLEKTHDWICGNMHQRRNMFINNIQMRLKTCRWIDTMCKGHRRRNQLFYFLVTFGLNQECAFSLCLFSLIMYKITRHIQDEVLQRMLFADDSVLIDETRVGIEHQLELTREALEFKGFQSSELKFNVCSEIFVIECKEVETWKPQLKKKQLGGTIFVIKERLTKQRRNRGGRGNWNQNKLIKITKYLGSIIQQTSSY